jgi:hypothetical protein
MTEVDSRIAKPRLLTWRSVLIGLGLGLFVSIATPVNNQIIGTGLLIGYHLPIVVVAATLVLAAIVNPLLSRVNRSSLLGPGEILIIAAIGMAACSWPSLSFFRSFASIVTMPSQQKNLETNWQNARVMSYLPGGSPELAIGQVRDWQALGAGLIEGQQAKADRSLQAFWSSLGERDQLTLQSLAEDGGTTSERRVALDAINFAMQFEISGIDYPPSATDLEIQKTNRQWLVQRLPETVSPTPNGGGWLLENGSASQDTIDALSIGAGSYLDGLRSISLKAWMPTILLWGLVALTLGVAVWALALIVHPQWSRRELLPYPIVQIFTDLVRREEGSAIPTVMRTKMFWVPFILVFLLHLVNGLHQWFPAVPKISLTMPFMPLLELFPAARGGFGANHIFSPTLYLSVIAIAYMLQSQVSLSVGLSGPAFLLLYAIMASRGESLDFEYIGADDANLLRFGGYLAMFISLVFAGRHYYRKVALASIGIPQRELRDEAAWAGRLLLISSVAAVVILWVFGLPPIWAAAAVLLFLMASLVMSRIIAETGLFYMQIYWMPVGVLTALFGFETLGPTTYIALALFSIILLGDPRTLLLPFMSSALQAVEKSPGSPVGKASPWLLTMIVVGFLVAGIAVLGIQYGYSNNAIGGWAKDTLPAMPFDSMSRYLGEAEALGTLEPSVNASFTERLAMIRFDGQVWSWMAIGFGLVLLTAFARLKLSWWPIHPVLFLIWGTFPSARICVAFLVGWLIRRVVVSVGGAGAYRSGMPIVMGVLVSEVAVAAMWIIIGAVYYLMTGLTPTSYKPYP